MPYKFHGYKKFYGVHLNPHYVIIENDIFMNEVVSISYYGTLDTYQIFLFDVMHFMMY